MIKRLHTVLVPAGDVARGATFYEEAFGFETKFADGDRWIQLAGHGFNLAIASMDEAAPATVGMVPVFEATDEEDHARLIAAGATEVARRDMGDHGSTRSYYDPNGNLLQLFWRA